MRQRTSVILPHLGCGGKGVSSGILISFHPNSRNVEISGYALKTVTQDLHAFFLQLAAVMFVFIAVSCLSCPLPEWIK